MLSAKTIYCIPDTKMVSRPFYSRELSCELSNVYSPRTFCCIPNMLLTSRRSELPRVYQIISFRKRFVTSRTCEWLLSSVNSSVCIQTAFLRKRFVAFQTCIWFLTSVNLYVFNKVTFQGKRFCRVPDMRMASHQYESLHALSKRISTGNVLLHSGTCKWLITSVNSSMSYSHGSSSKTFYYKPNKRMVFHQCEFSHASSTGSHQKMF